MNLEKARVYFPKKPMSYAPRFTSRRFGTAMDFVHRCYREDGDGDDDDDVKTEKRKLLKTIQGIVEKKLEGRASKSDVDEVVARLSFLEETVDEKGVKVKSPFPIQALREMADEKNGVMSKLIEMGTKLQEFEAAQRSAPKDMSIRSQIERWMESTPKQLGGTRTVKSVIESIRAGVQENLPALEIRAVASPMTVATVNSGNSPYIGSVESEGGVNGILRYPNTFWDFLKKGRTSSETYTWANLTNPQGAAAFIGPGVAKPGISFEIVTEKSNAKKIADSLKCGTELLQDIDGMESFIMDELREQVMLKVNETLMTGVSSTTVPAGIQTLSTTYTLTTIKTTNPTYVDAVRAVVGQLRSGKLTGDITVFINSIDAANMDIAKATDSGVYLLPPFVTADGRKIGGATIIEDPNVPVGYFQAGFMKYYRILIYKDFTVSWGWENNDFTLNLVTAIGEMRLHQFFNTRHTGAFVYDTFENVSNAIRKA